MAFGDFKRVNLSGFKFDVFNINIKNEDGNFSVDPEAYNGSEVSSFVTPSVEGQSHIGSGDELGTITYKDPITGEERSASGAGTYRGLSLIHSAIYAELCKNVTDEDLEKYGLTREQYDAIAKQGQYSYIHPVMVAIYVNADKLSTLNSEWEAMSNDLTNHITQEMIDVAINKGYLVNNDKIKDQIIDQLSDYFENGIETQFVKYLISEDSSYFEGLRNKKVEFNNIDNKYTAFLTSLFKMYGCNDEEIELLLTGKLKFEEWSYSIINNPDLNSTDSEVSNAALERIRKYCEGVYLLNTPSIVDELVLGTLEFYFEKYEDIFIYYGSGDLINKINIQGFTTEIYEEIINSPVAGQIDFKNSGTAVLALLSYSIGRSKYYDDNGNFIGYTDSNDSFITDEEIFLKEFCHGGNYCNYDNYYDGYEKSVDWSFGTYEDYYNGDSYWANVIKEFISNNPGLSDEELRKKFVIEYYYDEIKYYIDEEHEDITVEDFVNNNSDYRHAILATQATQKDDGLISLTELTAYTIKSYYNTWVENINYYTDVNFVLSREDAAKLSSLPDDLLYKIKNDFNGCSELEIMLAVLSEDFIIKLCRDSETEEDYYLICDKDGKPLGNTKNFENNFVIKIFGNYCEYLTRVNSNVSGLSEEDQINYKGIELVSEDDIKYWIYLYNTKSSDYVINYLNENHYDRINDKIITMRDMRTKSIVNSMHNFFDKYGEYAILFDPTEAICEIIEGIFGKNFYADFAMANIGVAMLPFVLTESVSITLKSLSYIGKDLSSADVYSYTAAFRSRIGESIADSVGWEFVATIYSGIVSFCDSLAIMLATAYSGGAAAFVQGIGLCCLASMSFQQTLFSALERGVDFSSALFCAILAFIAEFAFEKIGMDAALGKLFKVNKLAIAAAKGAGKGIKVLNFFVNKMLIPGLANAGEETLTDLCNKIVDDLSCGDLSEYNLAIGYYINSGYSYQDAVKKAANDFAIQLGTTAAIGFASGMFMGIIGANIEMKTKTNELAGYISKETGMSIEDAKLTIKNNQWLLLAFDGALNKSKAKGNDFNLNILDYLNDNMSKTVDLKAITIGRQIEAMLNQQSAYIDSLLNEIKPYLNESQLTSGQESRARGLLFKFMSYRGIGTFFNFIKNRIGGISGITKLFRHYVSYCDHLEGHVVSVTLSALKIYNKLKIIFKDAGLSDVYSTIDSVKLIKRIIIQGLCHDFAQLDKVMVNGVECYGVYKDSSGKYQSFENFEYEIKLDDKSEIKITINDALKTLTNDAGRNESISMEVAKKVINEYGSAIRKNHSSQSAASLLLNYKELGLSFDEATLIALAISAHSKSNSEVKMFDKNHWVQEANNLNDRINAIKKTSVWNLSGDIVKADGTFNVSILSELNMAAVCLKYGDALTGKEKIKFKVKVDNEYVEMEGILTQGGYVIRLNKSVESLIANKSGSASFEFMSDLARFCEKYNNDSSYDYEADKGAYKVFSKDELGEIKAALDGVKNSDNSHDRSFKQKEFRKLIDEFWGKYVRSVAQKQGFITPYAIEYKNGEAIGTEITDNGIKELLKGQFHVSFLAGEDNVNFSLGDASARQVLVVDVLDANFDWFDTINKAISERSEEFEATIDASGKVLPFDIKIKLSSNDQNVVLATNAYKFAIDYLISEKYISSIELYLGGKKIYNK